jgi:hypothetical protein
MKNGEWIELAIYFNDLDKKISMSTSVQVYLREIDIRMVFPHPKYEDKCVISLGGEFINVNEPLSQVLRKLGLREFLFPKVKKEVQ